MIRSLSALDFTLARWQSVHMHAGSSILNNYWEWSGGDGAVYGMGNREGRSRSRKIRKKGTADSWTFLQSLLYTRQRCVSTREYIKQDCNPERILSTARRYYKDPTIMSWQAWRMSQDLDVMVNPGRQNLPLFYQWIDSSAQYIHSLDTNHLVSTGSEGKVGCIQSEKEAFLEAHKSKHIDYLTFHLWAAQLGIGSIRSVLLRTLPVLKKKASNISTFILLLAVQLNKTYCDGRIRDWQGITEKYCRGTPKQCTWSLILKFLYQCLYDSACNRDGPIAGSNIWSWGGESSAQTSKMEPGNREISFTRRSPQWTSRGAIQFHIGYINACHHSQSRKFIATIEDRRFHAHAFLLTSISSAGWECKIFMRNMNSNELVLPVLP